jgi:hypothetical protein
MARAGTKRKKDKRNRMALIVIILNKDTKKHRRNTNYQIFISKSVRLMRFWVDDLNLKLAVV